MERTGCNPALNGALNAALTVVAVPLLALLALAAAALPNGWIWWL
jgi:hypothetical protein